MILVIDVAYFNDTASIAGILFCDWNSDVIFREIHFMQSGVAEYVPGRFYLRELPCILALLAKIDEPLDCVILDGYVTLGADRSPGIGMRLWDATGGKFPIIGVAKTEFVGTPLEMKLPRGESAKPLFVSSIGMELELAKSHIASMHGPFRLPTILKAVDSLCRKGGPS